MPNLKRSKLVWGGYIYIINSWVKVFQNKKFKEWPKFSSFIFRRFKKLIGSGS